MTASLYGAYANHLSGAQQNSDLLKVSYLETSLASTSFALDHINYRKYGAFGYFEKKEKSLRNTAKIVNFFFPLGVGSLIQGDLKGFGTQLTLNLLGYSSLGLAYGAFYLSFEYGFILTYEAQVLLGIGGISFIALGGFFSVASFIHGLVRPDAYYYKKLLEISQKIKTSYQLKKHGNQIDRQVFYNLPVARF